MDRLETVSNSRFSVVSGIFGYSLPCLVTLLQNWALPSRLTSKTGPAHACSQNDAVALLDLTLWGSLENIYAGVDLMNATKKQGCLDYFGRHPDVKDPVLAPLQPRTSTSSDSLFLLSLLVLIAFPVRRRGYQCRHPRPG
ncbi:hypothetical protein BDW62DRAFT_184884, partial [Aspergillus aurantiobrunneus]